jgi:hypothetical protein
VGVENAKILDQIIGVALAKQCSLKSSNDQKIFVFENEDIIKKAVARLGCKPVANYLGMQTRVFKCYLKNCFAAFYKEHNFGGSKYTDTLVIEIVDLLKQDFTVADINRIYQKKNIKLNIFGF